MNAITYLAKMAAYREKRAALWDKLFRMGMLTPKSMRRLYRGANVKKLELPDSPIYEASADTGELIRGYTKAKPLSRVKNKDLVGSIKKKKMNWDFDPFFRSLRAENYSRRHPLKTEGHWLWDVIRKGLQPSSTASNPMQAGRFLKLQQGKTQAATGRAAEATKNKATKAMRKTPQSSRKSDFKQKIKQENPYYQPNNPK